MEQDSRRSSFFTVAACAVILAAAPVLYSYITDHRFQQMLSVSDTNPTISGAEADGYIAQMRGAAKIPQDEIPTVIRVTDTAPLISFGNVRKGDVILLYRRAGLAVVYDPLLDRLINALSVTIKSQDEK